MADKTTISESDVLARLQEVTVIDKGRKEYTDPEGIHELAWWDISPEDADSLSDLNDYDNVGLRPHNTSTGPDMDDTHRLAVSTCIIPVAPDELARHEAEQYDEEYEAAMRERYENDA
jgi:hypothetical protein